jgi:hypothetical protein
LTVAGVLLFHLIFRWIPIKDVLLFAIDISFAICIVLGYYFLKTDNIPKKNLRLSLLYFICFISLSVFWFVFSPNVALQHPSPSFNFEFSLIKFNKTYNNYNFFNLYGIIRVLILVPILEEVFYRRIILNSLLEKHNAIFAILVSSVMFSVGHLDFNYSIVFFVGGIMLGFLYYKTYDIKYAIGLHIFINFLTIFFIEK